MAERWFVASGNWVAANFNGGTLPAADDDVFANGFAATINTSIAVKSLSKRAGSTAVAGGSFTTSGTVTATADSYAGSSNCLILESGGTQIGNSYGSNTTGSRYGTTINFGGIQNGNGFGGTQTNSSGTLCNRGTMNGDATGGSASGASGFITSGSNGGILNGNSYGGTATNASGAQINAGGMQNGNSFGSAPAAAVGTVVSSGGIQNGNSTGGGAASAHGTTSTAGGLFFGQATGSTTANANGVSVGTGGNAIVTLATGNASSREGVRSNGISSFIEVVATIGTNPTSISGALGSDLPFYTPPTAGGFPLSRIVN